MRKPSAHYCLTLAGLLALFSVQLSAQKPNLSGKWTLVTAPELDPVRPQSSPLGYEGNITQDGTSVTFTTGNRSITYRLDLPESQNPLTTMRGDSWLLASQARWVQNALLVVTKTTSPIGTWEDMLICSLDGDGNLNVVVLGTPKSQQAAMITTLLTYRRN
jgi:hypothetical protein